MGGTTAKICLIDDFQPHSARAFEVARQYRFLKGSGLPVRIPVTEMVEIGAGGGSIAHVDTMGRIAVGPESAGAEPGPACYGRGGTEPTVTDANVALGRIDPEAFAAGTLHLDRAASEKAIASRLGDTLGMTAQWAAAGIGEIVEENMANAARVHAVERGKELQARTLIAFGGAAPLHAARLAEKLGIDSVIIPTGAGVGSAVGFLAAPVAYEVVRSRYMRLDAFDAAAINAVFEEMRDEAQAVVEPGARSASLREVRTADMRYRGQGHEIAVPLGDHGLEPAALRAAFDATYTRLFGRTIPRLEIEAVTWTLSLSQPSALPDHEADPPECGWAAAEGTCRTIDPATGDTVQASVYSRARLALGARLAGPASIIEDGTTTIVPGGFIARIKRGGEILIEGDAT